MCSICVSVCPNLALMTYRTEPFSAELPEWKVVGGGLHPAGTRSFRVCQLFQIVVLTDFCDECGNCETFCPTSGRPYRDKPRLYLRESEFAAEADNAFMIVRRNAGWSMKARFRGETHQLAWDDELTY